MDQNFGSQCSSGGESGWTFYLEKSKNVVDDEEEEEDDDLSMVSDASSGPPYVQHQEQECNNTCAFNEYKKEKIVKDAKKIQDLPCYIDDTSSSSFSDFSHVGDNQDIMKGDNVIVDYSKDQIKSKSRLQDQYGLFDSSVSATQSQQNQLCPTFKV
uniref:protein SOB FIVE-LIKE 5-like isoform X2 n=1 Tax=Erigeron canadensis TaxID=72917 RepID=UPI001CB9C760|nr:protein SOB FIVE-LIKE 5-like isoform X2 [Erigeron canadensis]